MSRTLLAWCCAALSSCLIPSPARSMTVMPIVFSTSTPSPAPTGDHHHHYRGGALRDGPYGGRGTGVQQYSYGHRTLPASDVARVRVGRDQQSHALYESPHTYEYMTDPRRGSRLRQDGSRVPKTERRPPGDDVEYVVDARPPARDRRRYGHNTRYRAAAGDGRYDGGDGRYDGGGGRHEQTARKRKRKSPSTGGRAVEPEVGSSSKKNVRKDTAAKVRDANEKQTHAKKNGARGDAGAGNGVKKIRESEEIVDGDPDAQVNHKIHKKNEYSKKQQFFDEEHVDHGKKKPILNRDRNKRGHKKRASHDNSSKKRKRKVTKDTDKDHANLNQKQNLKQKPSQGYGQILAVR